MHSKAIQRCVAVLGAVVMVGAGTTSLAYAGILGSPSLTGVEIAATSTEGTFVGTAVDQTGGLSGSWKAVVDHSSLTPCTGLNQPCAWVTGGSFNLYTALNGQLVTITGSFDGATGATATDSITPTQLSSGCGNEKFLVTDTLHGLGINGPGQGSGRFTVVLTHYRTSIFGFCLTYSATVIGTASLSLP